MKNPLTSDKVSGNFKLLPLAALLLATISVSAQAEQWAPTATKVQRFDSTATNTVTPLSAMQAGTATHVVVTLKLRNQAGLDALTKNIIAGNNKPISSAEFLNTYAPTAAQVQAVVDHMTKSGFTNITVADNRMLVSGDGTAGSVKTGFNTDLHTYSVNGRTAHANTSEVSVPQSLAGSVLAVHGLQTIHRFHSMVKPMAAASTTGIKPTDFSAIYNASGLPSATNATIGIITQGSMTQTVTDLNTFAANSGYPKVNLSTVTVGTASTDTAEMIEWNLDTQDALAAAGGTIKQMILYTANTLGDADLTSTLNRAVSDNLAKTINVSLGECENDAKTSGLMASADQIFQAAVAQGQTFSVSSGDSGAYECGSTGGKAQAYPSVSPYVMSVGGTLLTTNGSTWVSESVWACSTAANCQQSSSGGAGGGPSLTESAPSWQTSAGVLGPSTMRGVPDIALDASPTSGAIIIVKGANQTVGGTSLAAPLFTGFWARVQSMNNNSLAFPATTLYQKAAANPGMFHDITSGSNGGYSASTGWDYASGYGSLNMANFATVMSSAVSTTTSLTKDVSVGFSGATGTQSIYTFFVPAGSTNLSFKMSGGTGNGDLYTQLTTDPTTSSYLAKSAGSTNTESILIAAPTGGTYHLLATATAAVSGASIVATYQAAPSGNTLTSGVPVTGITLAQGATKVYSIVVPAGKARLTFQMYGGTGDGDLYAKYGAAPTTMVYDGKSAGSTNTEGIVANYPAAGTYYVMVYGYAAVNGATLVATVQ